MKIMRKYKIHKTVKIWLKMIKISKIDDTRHLTEIAEKGSKWAQNGSKWCFWAKGAKRPKKAKNREKRLKFGQKW